MDRQAIKWTATAKKSLQDIVSFYNKRNGNNDFSKKITEQIKTAIALLPSNNFMGKAVENSNLRVLILERHHVFYQVGNDIEIRLVWDCRQNEANIPILGFNE